MSAKKAAVTSGLLEDPNPCILQLVPSSEKGGSLRTYQHYSKTPPNGHAKEYHFLELLYMSIDLQRGQSV